MYGTGLWDRAAAGGGRAAIERERVGEVEVCSRHTHTHTPKSRHDNDKKYGHKL